MDDLPSVPDFRGGARLRDGRNRNDQLIGPATISPTSSITCSSPPVGTMALIYAKVLSIS